MVVYSGLKSHFVREAFVMKKEKLSTSATFFYKFIYTVFWIGPFGCFCIYFLSKFANRDQQLLYSSIWLLISFLFVYLYGPIKTVFLCSDELIISNYFKTIKVPVSQIKNITGGRIGYPGLTTVTFKQKTLFGKKVRFLPKRCFLFYLLVHPAERQIEKLKDIVLQHA